MKTATLLLTLLLSHNGYWFGGQDADLTVRPLMKMPATKLEMAWRLTVDKTDLGGGTLTVKIADQPVKISIRPPAVKQRADLVLRYSFRSTTDGSVLQHGELPLHLFPSNLIADHGRSAEGKRIVVYGENGQLVKFLRRANLKATSLNKSSRLELLDPDIVFVGQNRLSGETERAVLSLVRSGSSVLMLAQDAGDSIHGWRFASRPAPEAFVIDRSHPLFRGLDPVDLKSLATTNGNGLVAIQVPPDAPALVLAAWPSESQAPGTDLLGPLDALVITQTLGRGRLLLCQLPLDDYAGDPRVQLILNNALDYLLSRPEPTPKPSERPVNIPVPPRVPDNRIPLQE